MSKRLFLLTSLILVFFPVSEAFSQANQNSIKSINKIKKIVKSITANTTLKATVLDRSNVSDSAIKKFKTYRGSIQQITAFLSGDTLKRIKINGNSFYSAETDYYFDDGRLIFVVEKYHNNSRMGSCGDLDIENHLYYSSKKLIKVDTIEIPFNCYNEKVKSEFILTDLTNILTFLRIYVTKNFR